MILIRKPLFGFPFSIRPTALLFSITIVNSGLWLLSALFSYIAKLAHSPIPAGYNFCPSQLLQLARRLEWKGKGSELMLYLQAGRAGEMNQKF